MTRTLLLARPVALIAIAAAAGLSAGCQTAAGPAPTIERTAQVRSDTGPKLRLLARGDRILGSGASNAAKYLAGRYAMSQRDYGHASRFLSGALALDPDNLNLMRRTFLVVLGEGDIGFAERLAEQILERDPEHTTAQLVLAIRNVRAGAFDKANARFEAMPDEGLTAIINPVLHAWVRAGNGDADAAIGRLDKLLQNPGASALAELHAGLIRDQAGLAESAVTHFANLRGSRDALSLRTTRFLGNFYLRADRRDEARELYRTYRDQNPDTVAFENELERIASGLVPETLVADARMGLAEALFDIANLLHQERASDTAMLYAQMALSLRPGHLGARLLQAEVFETQQRHERAIEAYGEIPADSAYGWVARLRTAENLEALDRTDEAITLLESMASERAERHDALTQIGNMLRGRERFTEAARAYDRAIERLGDQVAQRHWTLLYARGIALERTKQWSRAEVDFLKALELEPDQPYVLNYLGYSWAEKGINLDRAMEMIKTAVEQRPNDGYIVDSLGWVYFRIGRYQEAVKHLERAVELRPQDPTINDHLGDVYWKVGRHAEARFQWRRSLSLDPEPDTIAAIEAKLRDGLDTDRADLDPAEVNGAQATTQN